MKKGMDGISLFSVNSFYIGRHSFALQLDENSTIRAGETRNGDLSLGKYCCK